jgi:predicted HicB family RNase H-like nuclease
MTTRKPLQLRLPTELKDWIAAQAAANVSSQNSEIIRAIRERMERNEQAAT